MNTIVQLNQVSKLFKGKPAVDNISFRIEEGSITAILGPNGAGKTTTISMMLGLINSSSGSIQVFGEVPAHVKVREQIGAMLQDVRVLDGLKVDEIIDLFRSYYSNPLPRAELLRISGLEQERKKFTSKLSGGQKRRLGFALAMAGNPKLLFLDEPTAGMDVVSRRFFWSTIDELVSSGTTVIFTSHDLHEVEDIADRIIMLHAGQIIADGTPEEVKAQLTEASVSYVGDDSRDHIFDLKMLACVTDVITKDGRIILKTANTDAVIHALFAQGEQMRSIQIEQGRLDDAFIELTRSQEEAAV